MVAGTVTLITVPAYLLASAAPMIVRLTVCPETWSFDVASCVSAVSSAPALFTMTPIVSIVPSLKIGRNVSVKTIFVISLVVSGTVMSIVYVRFSSRPWIVISSLPLTVLSTDGFSGGGRTLTSASVLGPSLKLKLALFGMYPWFKYGFNCSAVAVSLTFALISSSTFLPAKVSKPFVIV